MAAVTVFCYNQTNINHKIMDTNYVAILGASVAQFIFSAIWYMPLFGKTWGKIHGFDQVPKEQQAAMTKGMMPLLVVQFIFTVLTSLVFAWLYTSFQSDWSIYQLAFLFWLGFLLPTQVSAVIFGGTKEGWVMKKIAIMAGASLINMEIIALVLTWFAK